MKMAQDIWLAALEFLPSHRQQLDIAGMCSVSENVLHFAYKLLKVVPRKAQGSWILGLYLSHVME